MTTLRIDGPAGDLAIFEMGSGDGTPILFLHGDSSRATAWDAVIRNLSNERRMIAFDFRGHGESAPAGDGDYGYPARAADVGAVADTLQLEAFVLVAHSGGGGAALEYAANNPDRVAGILLVDPATDPRLLPEEIRAGFVRDLAGPNSLDVQKAYYASIAGSNPSVVARVLADTEAVHPAARHGVAMALAEWNPEPTLNAYRGPMLLLATSAGDTPAALYRLRRDIPYRVVPDAGHWLHIERPDVVAAAVAEFVADIESSEQNP